ncbi:hypothetical protein HPB47_020400 [Ixodes persulcatus]|uniref:Uncharacterized protein n=1 Tax=Ixodes persulcatus TaxID=34615 RepID=A0AC60QGH2_IXOPE|nr:hypothetical protein HPB47_020400 [Ixodes persulcatus]
MEYLRVCVRWLILCVLVTPILVIEGKPCGPAKYRDCLEAIAKQCHENLHYRLLVAGLKNCTSTDNAAAVTPTSLPQPPEATCQWLLADGGYGQCGLYGDPHLQTFGGKLQTCRAVGAWPMVDNAYLAVQVTNSHAGATATVVSKVTVVVHSHGWDDVGRPRSGAHDPELDLVELTLYHAGVRLRIRQHGDFLSVTLRMPTQIADMGTPLCSQGCPTRELLPELRNVEQWRREKAESSCTKVNLTGAYWDACVFDVLSTEDARSAEVAGAASAAVADLRSLGASPPVRESRSPSEAPVRRASAAVVALSESWHGLARVAVVDLVDAHFVVGHSASRVHGSAGSQESGRRYDSRVRSCFLPELLRPTTRIRHVRQC